MRKSVLAMFVGLMAVVFLSLQCGKSHCKRYAERFCQDEKSPACAQAKEKTKDWSSNTCRLELNKVLIEDQSQTLDKELQ